MEDKMEYEAAPEHQLSTWARLRFMITWSSVGIALVLYVMFLTLTP